MQFKIPKPVIPTEEQMQEIANEWWDRLRPTTFLAWNKTLLNNSFPLSVQPLPKSLMHDITHLAWDGKGNHVGILANVSSIIDTGLKELGNPPSYFIKLVSRSPKDSLESFEITSHEVACDALLNSMRVFDDLCMLRYIDEACMIIRPFVKFEEKDEWRVLVEAGKIVGISQYHYNSVFEYQDLAAIESKIRKFVDEVVVPNMPIPDFVADIITMPDRLILLETNPFGISDPCLFISYDRLDGTLKVA